MNTKISIKISILEAIIEEAKKKLENDTDLSETLELVLCSKAKWHNGTDDIKVYLESVYAECNSKFVCQNF